jgi:putative peptidoglycan lipid II flippase
MVERLWRWLNQEWGSIHQAALLLGFSALGSQILALVRDRLLASTFGAGSELDLYYVAFRLPDLLYVSLASFVSVTVLIPFIIERFQGDDLEPVRRFLNSVLTAFFLVMVPVAVILYFLTPTLAPYLAPGFSEVALRQLVVLIRILLLSPILLGLSNLLGAVTQATQRFFLYALSPILYNVGIIAGVIFFYPLWGLAGLAWGVVLGAVFHVAIQVPGLVHLRLVPRLTGDLTWSDLRRVVLVSLPRTLTLSAHQLSLLVLVSLASFMGAGSVAIFNFALNLHSVPLSIIGVSYSVAAFPLLAKLFSNGERERFVEQVTIALRHILFWSWPAVVMFIVLRAQIVRVILGAGKFDWQDTRLTAAALGLFAVSVVAQSVILLLVRGYYACGRTRRPLILNVCSSLLIVALAWLLLHLADSSLAWRVFFERLLRVSNLEHTEVLLLPFAFTLGVTLNALLFWFFFQRDFGRFPGVVDRALGQSIFGSLVGGIVSYQALQWLGPLLDLNKFWGIFTQGLVAGLLGLGVLVLLLKSFGNKEIADIERSLKQRFWKSQTIAPEPEGL